MTEEMRRILSFPVLLHVELRLALGDEEYRRLRFSFELDDHTQVVRFRMEETAGNRAARRQLVRLIGYPLVGMFAGPSTILARDHAEQIAREWKASAPRPAYEIEIVPAPRPERIQVEPTPDGTGFRPLCGPGATPEQWKGGPRS